MRSLMPEVVAAFAGSVLLMSAVGALAQPGGKPRASMAPAQVSTARGVIKSVTGTRLVLEATPAGSGPERFVLDDKTAFQRLGKTLTVKDLKAGDPVTVSYLVREGQAVASRVWVRYAHAGAGASSGGNGAMKGR